MTKIKTVEGGEAEDILHEIEEQAEENSGLLLELNTAMLVKKTAQKAYEDGVARLGRLTRTRLEDNPLFDQDEDESEEG